MARASIITKLPLDRWFRILGIHPLHANQVYTAPITLCGSPWFQHGWQDADRIGREEVAQAIAQAEAEIETYLKYRLMPSWEVDEWQPTVRPIVPELLNESSADIRGFGQVARVNWGEFITGGIRSKEVVEAGVAVAYTDEDGDGYDETATITAAVTFSNECEIRIYFPTDSGGVVDNAGDDRWEIRPIEVLIAGGTATIKVRRELLVSPDEWEKVSYPDADPVARALDGSDNGNFIATVDVYRVYNDPQQQVTLLWEPFASNCASCTDGSCPACAYNAQTGCLLIRGNPRNSMIVYHPADWDSDNLQFTSQGLSMNRQPDLVRVWYYAGLRDKGLDCPTREMSQDWAFTVAVYAASLLERSICNCENAKAFIERWQMDLAKETPEFRQKMSRRDLDNPFGTRAGAVYAWNRVRQAAAVGEAVLT